MIKIKKKSNKNLLISVVIILAITLGTIFMIKKDVYAYELDISFADTGGSSGGSGPQTEYSDTVTMTSCPLVPIYAKSSKCYISYNYKFKTKYNEKIIYNGYDRNNESLYPLEINSFTAYKNIEAGTPIGISIYTKKVVGYDINPFEVTYHYKYAYDTSCISSYLSCYCNTSGGYSCDSNFDPNAEGNEDYSSCSIPQYTPCQITMPSTGYYSKTLSENTNDEELKKQYNTIKEEAITNAWDISFGWYFGVSTYQVILPDSNDVNGNAITKTNFTFDCYDDDDNLIQRNEGETLTTYGGRCQEKDITKFKDERTQMTYYTINKTCINAKTGNVRYITDNSDCSDEEITVENEETNNDILYTGEKETHWHYFTPLNAKSTNPATINIRYLYMSNKTFTECAYVMDNNVSSYTKLITKYDDTKFKGDYNKCDGLSKDSNFNAECSARSDDFKYILERDGIDEKGQPYDNVCRILMEIDLPIEQKFYLEAKDENDITWLKGFNFYYKPIDVNNPFPNDVPTNTLWDSTKYNETNNTYKDADDDEIKLEDSYNQVTYTTSINASSIRNYNKDNEYTDWSNMKLDGTSEYIDKEGIIKRINTAKVYKLGCGPLNVNEYLDEAKTQINLLYRKECKQ